MRLRGALIVVMAAALLAGCGTVAARTKGKPLVLTVGELLSTTYQTFKSLDDRYNAAREDQVITPEEFREWAEFSKSFNEGWQKAKNAYTSGESPSLVRATLAAFDEELDRWLSRALLKQLRR